MPWRKYSHIDPRRQIVHATHKLGRRGTFLACLGVMWVLQGVSVILAPDSPTYLLLSAGGEWRAVAWIATGVVAIMAATLRQGDDAVGFLALYIMAAYRMLAYGLSAIMWAAGHDSGQGRGIVGMLSWGIVIVAILVTAGWPEPRESPDGPS